VLIEPVSGRQAQPETGIGFAGDSNQTAAWSPQGLDSQAFTALGTASIDHSTPTTGFHADQKPVRARTANLRRLVGAFHI